MKVETLNNYGTINSISDSQVVITPNGVQMPVATPTGQAATADVAKSDELHFDHLPDKLRSPRAKELWRELFKEGYVNSDCLTNRSRVESAIMAHEMAKKLGLKRYWNDFTEIWQMKNLKSAHDKCYNGDNGVKFEKKIRLLFS